MAVRLFTSECCRAVIQHLATKELSRREVVRLVALAVLSSLGAFYASPLILKITLGTVSSLISLFFLSKIFARCCFKPSQVRVQRYRYDDHIQHDQFPMPPPRQVQMVPLPEEPAYAAPPQKPVEKEEGFAPKQKFPPEVEHIDDADIPIPSGSVAFRQIIVIFDGVQKRFIWNQSTVSNYSAQWWEGAIDTATATQKIKDLFLKAINLNILTTESPENRDIEELLSEVAKREDKDMAFYHRVGELRAAWQSTWHAYNGPDYGSSAEYSHPLHPNAKAARERILKEVTSYGKTFADLDHDEDHPLMTESAYLLLNSRS